MILGGDVPSMTEEGVNVVGGGMEKGHNLVTSLFKTAKQQEKTVAIVTDEVTMEEYERFPALVGEAKHVKTGGSCEEVVEMGCEAAVNHNMTICHVDLGKDGGEGESPGERMKKMGVWLADSLNDSEKGMLLPCTYLLPSFSSMNPCTA